MGFTVSDAWWWDPWRRRWGRSRGGGDWANFTIGATNMANTNMPRTVIQTVLKIVLHITPFEHQSIYFNKTIWVLWLTCESGICLFLGCTGGGCGDMGICELGLMAIVCVGCGMVAPAPSSCPPPPPAPLTTSPTWSTFINPARSPFNWIFQSAMLTIPQPKRLTIKTQVY